MYGGVPGTSRPLGSATQVKYDSPPDKGRRHQQHHHHRHHRRIKKSPPNLFTSCLNPSAGRRDTALRLKERSGMAVSIDSADEDDWDAPVINDKVWGNRSGPQRERPVDDLMITFQDLFPCLQPIFECCGCQQRKPRRIHPLKIEKSLGQGPKLETVCLDCGNVLDAKHLPRTIGIDMFDRGHPAHHQVFTHGLQGGEDDSPVAPSGTFEGYEAWTVMPTAPQIDTQPRYVPLPKFHDGPARTFFNRPVDVTSTTRMTRDFNMDDTGRIDLPAFKQD